MVFEKNYLEKRPYYKQLIFDKIERGEPILLGKSGQDGSVYLKRLSSPTFTQNEFECEDGTFVKLTRMYKSQFRDRCVENRGNVVEGIVGLSLFTLFSKGRVDSESFDETMKKIGPLRININNSKRNYSSVNYSVSSTSLSIALSTRSFDDLLLKTSQLTSEIRTTIDFCNSQIVNQITSEYMPTDAVSVVCDGLSDATNKKSDLFVSRNGTIDDNLLLSIKYGNSNKQIAQRNSANKINIQKTFWSDLGVNLKNGVSESSSISDVFRTASETKLNTKIVSRFLHDSLCGSEELKLLHIKNNSWSYYDPSRILELKGKISCEYSETSKNPKVKFKFKDDELFSIRYKEESGSKKVVNLVEKEKGLEKIMEISSSDSK